MRRSICRSRILFSRMESKCDKCHAGGSTKMMVVCSRTSILRCSIPHKLDRTICDSGVLLRHTRSSELISCPKFYTTGTQSAAMDSPAKLFLSISLLLIMTATIAASIDTERLYCLSETDLESCLVCCRGYERLANLVPEGSTSENRVNRCYCERGKSPKPRPMD